MSADEQPNDASRGVALLFRPGARPDVAAVRALAEKSGAFAVTHEGTDWLELLVSGLAFDLVGLGAGAEVTPAWRHEFGFEAAPLGAIEAIALVPGPHLVEGAGMMPVVRSQLTLALQLLQLPQLIAVGWAPAQSRMAVHYFSRTVTEWLEGGAFPSLGLTAIADALDGGIQSEGLAYFTGQELRIEPDLAEDRARATEIAVRLINELVAQEAVGERRVSTGPDRARLILEPSSNGKFVRVRAAP